jgi:hypothetical protein
LNIAKFGYSDGQLPLEHEIEGKKNWFQQGGIFGKVK